jgi:hypothetical protein
LGAFDPGKHGVFERCNTPPSAELRWRRVIPEEYAWFWVQNGVYHGWQNWPRCTAVQHVNHRGTETLRSQSGSSSTVRTGGPAIIVSQKNDRVGPQGFWCKNRYWRWSRFSQLRERLRVAKQSVARTFRIFNIATCRCAAPSYEFDGGVCARGDSPEGSPRELGCCTNCQRSEHESPARWILASRGRHGDSPGDATGQDPGRVVPLSQVNADGSPQRLAARLGRLRGGRIVPRRDCSVCTVFGQWPGINLRMQQELN